MFGNGEGAPLNVLIVVIFKTEYSRCINGVLSLHLPHLCVSYNIGFPIIFNTSNLDKTISIGNGYFVTLCYKKLS